MKNDFDEIIELLRGIRDMCAGLSVSELVEPHDKHVFGLIGDILEYSIPVLLDK